MKPNRAGMKLRRPHLKLMYVLVPDEELQKPHEMLWQHHHSDLDFLQRRMVADIYLSLVEVLVEQYSPPFRGGQKWDNRKVLT